MERSFATWERIRLEFETRLDNSNLQYLSRISTLTHTYPLSLSLFPCARSLQSLYNYTFSNLYITLFLRLVPPIEYDFLFLLFSFEIFSSIYTLVYRLLHPLLNYHARLISRVAFTLFPFRWKSRATHPSVDRLTIWQRRLNQFRLTYVFYVCLFLNYDYAKLPVKLAWPILGFLNFFSIVQYKSVR